MTSSTAFLFSLQNPEYLQPVKLEINASSINRGAIAALSDPLLGPVFGDGDLVISDMASTGIFSYSKLGRTYLLPDGIDPNTAAAHNLLAGSANFIPDEPQRAEKGPLPAFNLHLGILSMIEGVRPGGNFCRKGFKGV